MASWHIMQVSLGCLVRRAEDLDERTAEFLSLARSWFLQGRHTDVIIRCGNEAEVEYNCHKILMRDFLREDFSVDIAKLDEDFDELVIPDLDEEKLKLFIRSLYGFRDDFPLLASGRGAETKTPLAVSKVEFNADDDDALMEQLVIDPLEIKVKLEDDIEETIGVEEMTVADANDNTEDPTYLPHSPTKGGPVEHTCGFCTMTFRRADHLTRHLLQHTGERPFQCDVCNKGFTRKDKMVHHRLKQHAWARPLDDSESRSQVGEDDTNVLVPTVEITKPEDGMKIVAVSHAITNDFFDDSEGRLQIFEETEAEVELDQDPETEPQAEAPTTAPVMGTPSTMLDHNYQTPTRRKGPPLKNRLTVPAECVADRKGQFKCEHCDLVLTTLKKRKEHAIKVHHELLKESGLLYHRNNHVRIKNHTCPIDGCNKSFRHACEVADHVNVVHRNEKNYICELCSKSFPYKKSLRNHMDIAHNINKNESILCPKCGDIFPSRVKLALHVQSKHKLKVQKHQCRYCEFKTHARNVIVEHERTHTGEKPEICQWCGKGFNAKKTLRNHERLHTGEKPYKCLFCSASFAQRTSLNVHLNTHHKEQVAANPKKHSNLIKLMKENQNLNSNLPTAAAVPAVPADQNLNAADSAVADDDNCLELELPSFVPCRLKLREDLEAEGQHDIT